uniref:Pentatricopeptide repeat-containing protein At4g02750-like n=1 Tax=Cicer arietinum TaxID=3827 RepID=A0A3Q7XT21_CICAR|nr:pentatricopeptide repeat-containing protein At4g02750-like [Cicer arietinum]
MTLYLRFCPVSTIWKRKQKLQLFTTLLQASEPHPSHVISTNISIAHLAKTGKLKEARHKFDEMPLRTISSWNTMISGYSQWKKYTEALALVSFMHCSCVKFNEISFSAVLSACAHAESLFLGRQVHSFLLKSGHERFGLVGSALLYFYVHCFGIGEAELVFEELRDENHVLWSLMLAGYVQCDMMCHAMKIFEKMPVRDVVAWTTLISGYAKREDGCEKALDLFGCMRRSSEVLPNEFTLDCVIRICARLRILYAGKVVHGLCIKEGFDFDNSIGGALAEFYCVCENVDDAKRVYESMAAEACFNVTNSLIGGLVSMGRIEEAEMIFYRLREKNPISYNLMIKGYAMSGQFEKSKKLFERMSLKHLTSLNTMISVYSKNSELDEAVKIFDKTKVERNCVTWNSMMSGYIHNGQHYEALKLYVTMRRLSIEYSRSTFSVLFRACACLCSFQQGQLLHAHLAKTPYQQHGQLLLMVMHITDILMLVQGVVPNAATFVAVLSACSHAGLVDEGLKIFHSMQKSYKVTPTIEHYTCVVDLLGRSGRVKEADEFLTQMPVEADGVIWGALLNASCFWNDVEVRERASEKLFSLDPNPISAFVMLSNMYALQGRWGKKTKIRKRLQSLELRKDPGCSWIELNNNIHLFSVEDKTHPCSDVIYETVEHLTATINSIISI